MRTIAVIGLGNFGWSFVRKAKDSDLDLLCIDSSEDAVQRAAEWAARAVVADATDRRTLEELGVGHVDAAVVSLGDRLDATILCVLHLKSMGVSQICVKALSDDHERVLSVVGATRVIHPEREVAEELAREMAHSRVMRYLPLVGDYAVLELRTPTAFVGKTLQVLHLPRKHRLSVVALGLAGDPRQLEPPRIDLPLPEGSLLVLIGEAKDLERFQKEFGD